MGIGGALAEARTEAGLTITDVSERTRIREAIIRDIEHDDYSACGGDYYARGHIRAIARVVGTDPVPLIEEYDAIHNPPAPEEPEPGPADGSHGRRLRWSQWLATADGTDPDPVNGSWPGPVNGTGNAADTAPPGADAATADADTDPALYDARAAGLRGPSGAATMESVARWAGAARARLSRAEPAEPPFPGPADAPGQRASGPPPTADSGLTAAEAFRPALPLQPARTLSGRTAVIALAILAVIGLLIYFLVGSESAPAARHSHSAHAASRGARAGGGAGQPAASSSSPGTTRSPSASPSPSASRAPVVVALRPASAAAFGPGGTSQGDNPAQAGLAIDRSASTFWHSDWYANAHLGNLQPGTGLLLTMNQPVRVSTATLTLGPQPGGVVQIRAGNAPALASLPVVAQSANGGGTLTLRIGSPVTARYLLIWFTSLPPDGSGTYQARIFNISLSGTP